MTRIAVFCLGLLAIAGGCGRRPTGAELSVSDLLPPRPPARSRSGNDDWSAAVLPRQFAFPEDHAAHDDFRIEWWYYTGNLESDDGRRFGYQLTFFRTGLHKQPSNPSRWAVRDLYTAHFAVSDIRSGRHYCLQRNNRRGVGQAGADTDRYQVWNGSWRASLSDDGHRLVAEDSEAAIDLTLRPTKPVVLHGDQGLSQKGPSEGNASYYYSLTRMSTEGALRVGDQSFKVRGSSWMDHEFSTSFLEKGQSGWDWFAVQLEDGVDLMLYRMRREDGSTDPFSSGTLIDGNGDVSALAESDFSLVPSGTWRSEQTGAVYPLRWKIEIPSPGYQLVVRPAFDEQEMTTDATTGISYWEGAVVISGEGPRGEVRGKGYVELTGYAGQGLGSLIE